MGDDGTTSHGGERPERVEQVSLKALVGKMKDRLVPMVGQGRQLCPSCERSVALYCPECRIPCGMPEHVHLPDVRLPIPCHVVKHPREHCSKSTVIPGAMCAATDMVVLDPSECPAYDPEETFLVFPKEGESVSIDDIPLERLARAKTLVFVDGTWNQARALLRHERLAGLPKVHCHTGHTKTLFWRKQRLGPSFLATIEAIFYVYKSLMMRLEWTRVQDAAYMAACSGTVTAFLHDVFAARSCDVEAIDELLLFFVVMRLKYVNSKVLIITTIIV